MILITDKVEFRPEKHLARQSRAFFYAKGQINNEEDTSVMNTFAPNSLSQVYKTKIYSSCMKKLTERVIVGDAIENQSNVISKVNYCNILNLLF